MSAGEYEPAAAADRGEHEATLSERLSERPALNLGKVTGVQPRELLYRFAAGALTSVAAGVLTLLFGPRVGGIFLAFPAILAASLTLIEQEEDSTDAREDARGAIVGAAALAVFAVVAAVTLGHVSGAIALAAAAVAWLLAALLGYALLWWR